MEVEAEMKSEEAEKKELPVTIKEEEKDTGELLFSQNWETQILFQLALLFFVTTYLTVYPYRNFIINVGFLI